MRSEKEGEGGPGVAVTTRGPSGKEKPSPTESHFRRESQRREPEAPVAPSFGCGGGAVKPCEEKRTVLSKVVIRRLPPSLTKEQLEQQLHPLPAHDYFGLFTADLSLYPHLYSRAYINFRNPDDILLFRDRFDGYIFTDSKGLEYPAVVEFAPFQKTAKKKLKKKDTQTGSIEDDPEYKKFLETYCVEEEKTSANPETLLGDVQAKTRELIGSHLPTTSVLWGSKAGVCKKGGKAGGASASAPQPHPARRTTPLLEYIKNRKLEKQRIREEKREERRRRGLERKRLWEEEIRRRREEEKCKRKAAEEQKKTAEKDGRMTLLKKSEKGEESSTEKKPKERGEEIDTRHGKQEPGPSCVVVKPKPLESWLQELREKSQNDSDKEQRDMERRFRGKEPEAHRYHLDDCRKHRAHYEWDKFSGRSEEELKRGTGFTPDRKKKGSQHGGGPVGAAETPGRERSEDGLAPKKEDAGSKDRPGLQLYQPRGGIRARECDGRPPEEGRDGRRGEMEDSTGAGAEKIEEAESQGSETPADVSAANPANSRKESGCSSHFPAAHCFFPNRIPHGGSLSAAEFPGEEQWQSLH
ncbi:regulator of nonsense transcripts 3A isoform X2 [Mesoplodon densirostris]|uniref:regulator of nonsense transcripts 3A isoform X2 n=1 Tax=Mesoplodon densirostris TaxID=48708 RepID=UPI0028DB9B30|nr:regulator of nonsense transcripts 3A isoform X2 [Mesoplodon densirostris]